MESNYYQDHMTNSDISEFDPTQSYTGPDDRSEWLKGVSYILDGHEDISYHDLKPIKLPGFKYSDLRIPDFEFLNKYLGIK